MARYRRFISQFAATTGVVVMLAASAPAMAAEPATASEPAAKAATSPIKRHASRATRIAASHNAGPVNPIRRRLDCSGTWCGRQFVLMIGVAY